MPLKQPTTLPHTTELLPYYRIEYCERNRPVAVPRTNDSLPHTLFIERGVGFGDGRHETTQLCLLALGYLLKSQISPDRMLDFGAGNGILGIAAARRGVKIECVEIDEDALNEARRNAANNALVELFDFRTHLSTAGTRFELIAANILASVLLSFANELVTRLTPNGHLILSGLTSTDVPTILSNYRNRLPQHTPNIFERGSWRAVVFSPKP